MRSEKSIAPRPLILICLLLVIPAPLEAVLAYGSIPRPATDKQAFWALVISSCLALGLLARVRVVRLLAIFVFAALGVISLIMLILPILQMLSLRYFTLEAAILNTASLLYVGGVLAAALWLNGKEGRACFALNSAEAVESPNKSLNTDAGKAGAG